MHDKISLRCFKPPNLSDRPWFAGTGSVPACPRDGSSLPCAAHVSGPSLFWMWSFFCWLLPFIPTRPSPLVSKPRGSQQPGFQSPSVSLWKPKKTTRFPAPSKHLGISREPWLLLFFHLLFILYTSSQSLLGPGPISSHQTEAARFIPDELTLRPVMLIPLSVLLPSSIPGTIPCVHRFSFILCLSGSPGTGACSWEGLALWQCLNDVPWAALCTSSYA